MDSLTLGRINSKGVVAVFLIIIIVCEWVGGQRSVTLSDAIQVCLPVCLFACLPDCLFAYLFVCLLACFLI
jgi:Na+(H+)/acetate symporter ActP